MGDSQLAEEWRAMRGRSLQALPLAVAMLAILGGVVYLEGLHHSEMGFLAGVLVGFAGYWTVLEMMTIYRTGQSLRRLQHQSVDRNKSTAHDEF